MDKYSKIITLCISGLFLLGTVGTAIAEPQNKRLYAYQQTRKPVENSLIKPSSRNRPQERVYRQNTARNALKSGKIVSLSVIRRKIQKKYPGKIVDVRLIEPMSRTRPYSYHVKVLQKNGKLLLIKINATNARIVSVKGKG